MIQYFFHFFFYSILILFVNCQAITEPSAILSLSELDRVRTVGAREWNKIVNADGTEPTCWKIALQRFQELSANCASSQENTKTLLSLILTECHYKTRPGGFPTEFCQLSTINIPDSSSDNNYKASQVYDKELNNQVHSESKSIKTLSDIKIQDFYKATQLCLSHLSESAFQIYVQFFNHIDNICFYLQSTVWQERTEDTVNRLAFVSQEVVQRLHEAHRQNSLLIEQQKIALQYQQKLAAGSEKLQLALDFGQNSLQTAFIDMREEVQQEQKRLLSIFDDVFSVVGRIMHLQQYVAARLSDFETIVLYFTLIILTFYLTASDSTRVVRIVLYALWTFMICIEVLLWRLNNTQIGIRFGFNDSFSIRHVIEIWRTVCLLTGVATWISAWWRYKDPTTIIVSALKDGLQELKEQLMLHSTHHDRSHSYSVNNSLEQDVQLNAEYIIPSTDEDDDDYIDNYSLDLSHHTDTDSDIEIYRASSNHESSVLQSIQFKEREDDVDSVISSLNTSPNNSSDDQDIPIRNSINRLRRNPPRQSRPIAFRPPRLGSTDDIRYLKLNPYLLFESPAEFTHIVTNSHPSQIVKHSKHCHTKSNTNDFNQENLPKCHYPIPIIHHDTDHIETSHYCRSISVSPTRQIYKDTYTYEMLSSSDNANETINCRTPIRTHDRLIIDDTHHYEKEEEEEEDIHHIHGQLLEKNQLHSYSNKMSSDQLILTNSPETIPTASTNVSNSQEILSTHHSPVSETVTHPVSSSPIIIHPPVNITTHSVKRDRPRRAAASKIIDYAGLTPIRKSRKSFIVPNDHQEHPSNDVSVQNDTEYITPRLNDLPSGIRQRQHTRRSKSTIQTKKK